MNPPALLSVESVSISYPCKPKAVDSVSFALRPGERMGLVGESGSGKTSLARAILGLEKPSEGVIRFDGGDDPLPGRAARLARARLAQMVFQDPYHSLNPRRTVRQTLLEALSIRADAPPSGEADGEAARLLETVRLDADALDRYPHQFSGGQRQRICIARALAPQPRLLVCDEAVSALDVTTQRSIILLLRELGRETGISLLFITHDLPLVEALCERVIVFDRGRIVEDGTVGETFASPRAEKTRELLAAVLRPPSPLCSRPPEP